MRQTLSDNAIITRAGGNPSAVIDHETVIMSLDTGRFHVIAAASAVIWEQLDSPRTLGQLVTGLAARYDVGLEQCRDDVEEFVASLADRKLVTIQD